MRERLAERELYLPLFLTNQVTTAECLRVCLPTFYLKIALWCSIKVWSTNAEIVSHSLS